MSYIMDILDNQVLDRNIKDSKKKNDKKVYIETYGCQMNVSDTEIVSSILIKNNFSIIQDPHSADVIFFNTCSIRDKAEQRLRNRLNNFKKLKIKNPNLKIGVLGCMAERLKEKLIEQEKIVDIIMGPDSYRNIASVIREADMGNKSVNVILSNEETYADINPVRRSSNNVTAFISITRGCDNKCSFCVVPFTRGIERSRDPISIIDEAKELFYQGYRQVTLLGQNVDSYLWYGGGPKKDYSKYKKSPNFDIKKTWRFAKLLDEIAKSVPGMLIRFSTSNPQDMTEDVIDVIRDNDNVCNHIHLPVQSGSSRIIRMMRRGHSKEYYISLIDKIKAKIPDCAITHDMIVGYPTETDYDHRQTLELMDYVKYSHGFMFKYSERPGTYASNKHKDDVKEDEKDRRLNDLIQLQKEHSLMFNKRYINKIQRVLVEGRSKKSENNLFGRNSQNIVVIFPKKNHKKGDFIDIKIKDCTSASLIGESC